MTINLSFLTKPWGGKCPWLMWLLGAFFYAYENFLQVSPGVIADDLMRTFHVSAATLGNFSALYFYAYMAMQIPVGMLLDWLGPRILLTFAALLCAIGSCLFGLAQDFTIISVGRFLIGLGSSFAAVGCLYIASRWLPAKFFALTTGLLLGIGMLGAILGEAPMALLVSALDWRQAMLILAAIGLVLTLLIWCIIENNPKSTPTETSTTNPWAALKTTLRNKSLWITSIYGGLMFAPTPTLGGLWGVPYLVASASVSKETAASLVSMLFMGWVCGAPLFGWFSDFIQRRRTPLVISSCGTLAALLGLLYLPGLGAILLALLLFALGFFSSAFLPAFSIAKESVPTHVQGFALGFLNSINTLGVACAQPIIGITLDRVWQGHTAMGLPIYSMENYQMALVILPLFVVFSFVFLPFIRETFCRSLFEVESSMSP